MLGEGPIWHEERKSCFWVDIINGVLYEYKWVSKEIKTWQFDYKLTPVIQGKNNHLILGLNTGIARFDLKSETLEWLLDLEFGITENRCNDGRCDSYGRLWIGTMHMNFKHEAGSLYCINNNLQVHKKLDNVTISNGLVWSPDDTKFYFIDSPTQKVQSFIFDRDSGEIVFEKDVIQIPVEMGSPDGMAIDEEGMLWIAHWGGFGVYRWNPIDGKLIGKIELPVPNVSSCAFVGENLDHLVITTARENLNEEDLKKYPQSGDVFFAKPGVPGIANNTCLL
jgi:sugar lactone lactonase YvrE